MVLSQTEDKFIVNLDTSISPTLMGWLATLNTQVRIIKPQSLINDYQNYLKHILRQYGEDHETDQ